MSIFTQTELASVQTSKFDLSHDHKTTFNLAELVPTSLTEIIPGDKITISTDSLIRLQPMTFPIMHRLRAIHYVFFVPNRILWNDFEKFIVGTEDILPPTFQIGSDDVNFVVNRIQEGSLANYLGFPVMDPIEGSIDGRQKFNNFNILPFAAYIRIFDEYFRDQNLMNPYFDWDSYSLNSGDNTTQWKQIISSRPPTKAWQHDYFTSALPFAQKGGAVTLPIGGMAPVVANPTWLTQNPKFYDVETQSFDQGDLRQVDTGSGARITVDGLPVYYDPHGTLRADLNQATAILVEDLRRAVKLQEWLERNARGGTRYKEYIWAHFQVITSDARLQRPEFIGSYSQNIQVSEVISTAETLNEEGDPTQFVGSYAGHAISGSSTGKFRFKAEEHGFLITLTCVMPDTAYYQGLERHWKKDTFLDYYAPSFANLGEQEIYNYELYMLGAPENGGENFMETFGYIPRYSELKFKNNRISGEMATSLQDWHLGRYFEEMPALNRQFIQAEPQGDRVFVVAKSEANNVIAHFYHRIKAVRRIPRFTQPSLMPV